MKKRILSLVVVLTILMSFTTVVARAEIIDSGTCGDNLTWALDDNGTLTISGVGDMEDWSLRGSPWYNNSNIKKVVVEKGVTSIGTHALYYCTNISEIDIADTISLIGEGAFQACKSLLVINLPNSISQINDSAFAGCSKLETINLPNNLNNINNTLFHECVNLKGVNIPYGVTSIGELAFAYCYNLTSITIYSKLFSIKEYAFYDCSGLKDINYYGSETGFNSIIVNKGNDSISNATIHFVKQSPVGTFGNTNSTSVDAPIITSARINNNDLFTDKLNIDKDSATSYSVEGTVDANGCEDVHLYITQGSKKSIEIPLNACKNIQIGKEFSAGQPIYMTAIDKKTGKSTSKRTKLSVVGNKMFEGDIIGGDIKLFSDFKVNIPEGSVPILSGEYGLSLGSISTSAEIDGNEFKVSLGTDFLEGKKGSDGKWKKEDWEGFKKGFKSAKEKMRSNANGYKYLKNIAPKSTKLELSKGVGGSANVTGYIEGYIDDSGMHPAEGGIIVSAEIKYKYQGMTIVAVVPVYYEIGAGGEVTFVGGVKDLVPGNGLQGAWTGSITPAVFFEIGGGVGVPLVFTAGVSGKVKAELEIALNKVYQKFDVTGSAAFKLTGPFGIPTYKKDFAKGTFHIYETGNKNTLLGKTLNLYSLEDDVNNMYAHINIDTPIELAPHDNSTQNWVGDKNQISLFAADYTNQEINVLEENSYENIAPVFAKMNGKNVIAWITDNKSRSDGDKTMLVYSVEENGKWSAPKAVYDDGLADYSPAMKDGYIVWQKAIDNITSDITARDLGAICEIYMAKWNGNGFDEPVHITENSLIDQTPTLTVNNEVPTVVWVQNSENDFTGITGENRIMSYTNGKISTEQSINEAVTYLDCAYIDGDVNIAYETDGDKDLSTLGDREIYTVSKGMQSQITNNNLIDTHPVYADFNGNKTLFYYSDGKIVYLDNGMEKVVKDSGIATDQFTVISNNSNAAVLWTAVNDGTAEIHGALYDGAEWSEDVQISDLGQRVKYLSAVMNEDGSIFAVFNRTEKVSDGADYYVDGQSDLCTINVVPSYDLEITDAYFDEDAMTAYATVKNNGELTVDSYTIALADNQKTITEPLKAGESAEIEIAYNKPDDLSVKTIALSVAMVGGEEYNTENNSAVFSIGNADIDVENIAVDENETAITAEVSNIGYDNAQNVKVQLRDGSADGAVIEEKTVNLAVGATESVEFAIDKSNMRFFDAAKQLYVTAQISEDEVSLGNNDGYVIITSVSGLADYETEILSYNAVDGKYVINSVARNNTDNAISCIMYSAVYSEDGALKACGTVNADIDSDNDTGVDITVPCTIETGDTVKTFMWADNYEPLANVSELTVE